MDENYTYQEAVSRIKDRLDIVETVSEHVILKKSGGSYWGLCPFHKEKTPSFSVNPKRQIYKCFGCGEGGDAISFLMKVTNSTFAEVIAELAQKFGIELPTSGSGGKDFQEKKKKIISALEKTADYYTENLFNSQEAKPVLEYLKNRGLSEATIKEYRLGYAMNSYEALQEYFSKSEDKFDKETLEEAGLIIKREKEVGYVDRFRRRIIIPIFDETGTVIAFGARSVDENQNPKYLNSPDTKVYNKSKTLYGLYQAKDEVEKEDAIIIMEGYFDVISTQANGLKNCVASCGTSLTNEHIKLISRYTTKRRIYLAFDTDSAGMRATERGADLIKEALGSLGDVKQFDESCLSVNEDKYACEIRVITPPDGKDPDEFIRENGIEAYRDYLKKAPLLLDFRLNEILKEKTADMTAQDKVKLAKKLMPLLLEIKNNITRNEYIKLVAQQLEIDEAALRNELSSMRDGSFSVPQRRTQPIVKKSLDISEKAQKILLSLYLIQESTLNIEELSALLKEVEFDQELLKNIKCTIDKLAFAVNNVGELIGALYTEFAEDDISKEVLTDLVYLSDTFKELSQEDLKFLISEQINNIERHKINSKKRAIRAQYTQTNSDDEKARAVQLQLKEQLENKLRTGDI